MGGPGLPECRHRFIGQPAFDIVGQGASRWVSIVGPQRHRFQANGLQGPRDRPVQTPGGLVVAALHPLQEPRQILFGEGSTTREQAIKRGAQAVDIGPGFQQVNPAGRLLRTHVVRRAQGRAGQGFASFGRRGVAANRRAFRSIARAGGNQRLGQTPVDDQRFAELADHDV